MKQKKPEDHSWICTLRQAVLDEPNWRMFHQMKEIIVFLSFLQYIPYFISLYQGRSQPSISGWLCFALSLSVTMAASISLGTYSVLISCGLSLACQILIILIGIYRGIALRPDQTEKLILVFVFISIALWATTQDPSLAIYVNILVDALGTMMVIKKLIRFPATESPSTWFIGTLGSGLAVLHFFADKGPGLYYILAVFMSNTAVFILIILQEMMKINKAFANKQIDH